MVVWATYALLGFAHDSLNVPLDRPVTVRPFPQRFDLWVFLYRFVGEMVDFGPAALVLFLLARDDGGTRRIGLEATRVRSDVTFGVGLMVVAEAATAAGLLFAHLFDLPFRPVQYVNAEDWMR